MGKQMIDARASAERATSTWRDELEAAHEYVRVRLARKVDDDTEEFL